MQLNFKDKQVLVLGLGDTGLSALRWLAPQGARLSVADTREAPPSVAALQAEMPEVKVHLGAFDAAVFKSAEIIVLSPGVSVKQPLVQQAIQRGVPVVGDVELFAQYKPAHSKVIAITGSNGKSTVTTLVGEMCHAAGLRTIVAGNIGLPVLEALTMPPADVYVLELSSFQLETTTSLDADAATMLNLSEDHLDRHDGMDDYALAKSAIFTGAGVQVLNRDDSYSMRMALSGRAHLNFGLDMTHDLSDFWLEKSAEQVLLKQGKQTLLAMHELKISGMHNALNVLASLALCRGIGLDFAPLLQAAKAFKGLPHRVQWVADIAGVSFYDDSKGTNVGATCAAIAGMQQKVVLIAGGEGKGQDFAPLAAPVKQNARAVVLIGRDAALIEQALLAAEIAIYHAQDMAEAVAISAKVAQTGDAVLLSPACASFDMFRNYLHRAEVFIAAVQHMAQTSTQQQVGGRVC